MFSMLVTLVTLVTPFPKNFFQKLFRVENTIGANTLNIFSCMAWDQMAETYNHPLRCRQTRDHPVPSRIVREHIE